MKKLYMLTVIALFAGLLMSCAGEHKNPDPSGIDGLSVTFVPNPVHRDPTTGHWFYQVRVTETRGIGVHINAFWVKYYTKDGFFQSKTPQDTKIFAEWFNDCGGEASYIPGGGVRCANMENIVVGPEGYTVWLFEGTDDFGKKVIGEGRVDMPY